ncbi:hypothetical protein D3C76_1128760 [compost metagenome]
MVVGKRHRQWIQAELQQRDDEAHREQHLQRHGRQYRQRQGGQCHADCRATDQHRTVVAVRQPAQRPLHQEACKNAAAHEQANLLGTQALLRRIQRCQAIERADDQPRTQHGTERLRYALDKKARLHGRRVQGCRVDAPGEGHGYQAQQLQAQLRVHHQDQLPQHQPQVGGDHIAAEHRATLLGLGLLVEPAFDDHVLTHHSQANDDPQEQPGR